MIQVPVDLGYLVVQTQLSEATERGISEGTQIYQGERDTDLVERRSYETPTSPYLRSTLPRPR